MPLPARRTGTAKPRRATACRNCHGLQGQGAFGPDLAGRGLDANQVKQAVRKPWGIMPAFVESQLSDKDAADLAAYFASHAEARRARQMAVRSPRQRSARAGHSDQYRLRPVPWRRSRTDRAKTWAPSTPNFAYFANLVYNHTTALRQHRALLGNNATNIDMGNYSRSRLPEGQLRQIFFWIRDEIGFRLPMAGVLGKGETGPSGVTYTLRSPTTACRAKA